MTYAFLLYPHANVRYRQSLLQLATQELAMTLTALGREAEVAPKEMGGAMFLTFEAAKLTERDMRMLSQLASVYMFFSMEDPDCAHPSQLRRGGSARAAQIQGQDERDVYRYDADDGAGGERVHARSR